MPRQKKQHLKRRKDGRYCCKYHGIQFMGDTEDEALKARDDYKDAEKRGNLRLETGPTVAEYALKWLPIAKPKAAPSTYQESVILMNKLLKHIGEKYVKDVLATDIKAIYSEEFLTLSDSYIHTAKQLYIGLFDGAVSDGYCRINPAREKPAKPHRGKKGKHRAITGQERTWINTLCLDHRCRPAVMAMLYEGIRPQEAKALNIDRSVFPEENIVKVFEFAHVERNNHYIVNNEGKTKKATREIPLFSPFKTAIEGKSGPLIPTARGGDLTMQAWRVVWNSYVHQMERAINGMDKNWYRRTKAHKKILAEAEKLRKEKKYKEAKQKEAEIPPWINFTVVPYDLRHSFVSYGRDCGVELKTMVEWMGHADAKMVLEIYDEVSENRSKKEAEKVEKALIGMQNGMQKRVFHVKRSNIKRLRP